eukprot:2086926-Amphidinium_carterae.1
MNLRAGYSRGARSRTPPRSKLAGGWDHLERLNSAGLEGFSAIKGQDDCPHEDKGRLSSHRGLLLQVWD